MSSILRRLSNTPSASVERDSAKRESSTSIGSSTVLRKLSSAVSSSSLSSSNRRSSSLWTSVTSKAHTLFSKGHASTRNRNSSTQNPRIKAATTLCTIPEDPPDGEDEGPSKVVPDADTKLRSIPPTVESDTTSDADNTSHTVLAVDYQAPLGSFYMPRAIGIVVQPKTKNQSLLPSPRVKGPVALRAPRTSPITSHPSSRKTTTTSSNTPPDILRRNVIRPASPSKSRTQKHVNSPSAAHKRKGNERTAGSKQSSAPSKLPFPKGETKAASPRRYSRAASLGLSKKGTTRPLSLNKKSSMVGSPTKPLSLAAYQQSTSTASPKSSSKASQNSRRSKALPTLPRVALQHRISIKPPSFIPVNIVSSSDESEETKLSTPTRVSGKWRGSLISPTGSKPSRLPIASGLARSGPTHSQQRPKHLTKIVKTSGLPSRTALSNVKNTYQTPPAPVQASVFPPAPGSIPAVGNKGASQDTPSTRDDTNAKNIQRGPVLASSAKARSPREICTINAFAGHPSSTDEFVDKHMSMSLVGIRSTPSFISAMSPPVVEEVERQTFSKRGSRVGGKNRLSRGSVDISSLLGLHGRKVILSIVSSGSLSVLSDLDVNVGAAAEDSILAERPLSELFSLQTEVPMLSLMYDFPHPPSLSQFLESRRLHRQSVSRSHSSLSSSVRRNCLTNRSHRHTVHISIDEDQFSAGSYSLSAPEDEYTEQEMDGAKEYLEHFPEWIIEEDTTFIMTRFSNAYPSSLQFYPSPSISSSPYSLSHLRQNEVAEPSHGRISGVSPLTSDTDIIHHSGANRPRSSIAWESDQLSARMKSLEEDVWAGVHSTTTRSFGSEGGDTVRMSSCFGLSGVSDTNSLFDLSASWGRFGGNLLDVNLDLA